MVAKSYQGLKQITEPYSSNNKMYVDVQTNTGLRKRVRWYSDAEYAKMYPEDKVDKSKDSYYRTQKYVLGFDKGYITIFRNVKPEHEDWFCQSICRFARWWGWYVPSTEDMPNNLPLGVEPVKLYWDPMGDEEEHLCKENIVHAHVQSTLYSKKTCSLLQSEVGNRIERTVTVEDNILIENQHFHSKTNIHYLRDKDGNLYMWKTSAKNWSVGSTKRIRGTVKEYDEYKGEAVTVLTRCMEQ